MFLLCFLFLCHLNKLYVTRFSCLLTPWTYLFDVKVEVNLPCIAYTFYIVKGCLDDARFKHAVTWIFDISHFTISITLYKSEIVADFKRGYLRFRQVEVLHLVSDKIIHQRHVVNLTYARYIFWMRHVAEIHVKHFKYHIRI